MLKWDLCLVAAFQVVAALGQLVGVRLLTEVLTPAVFGEASLLLGVAALVTSTLINPSLQALLRYYPADVEFSNPAFVTAVAIKNIWRTVKTAVQASLPLLVAAVLFRWVTLVDVLLITALVGVDGLRMFQTSVLNATRQHGLYGAWQIGEAWGRPMIAYWAVTVIGVRTDAVLAAFVATSAALYVVLRRKALVSAGAAPPNGIGEEELLRNFRTYARPLIPVGLIGWISGMADRYMIGGLLSAKDVGTYVAVYGLSSRPMLMLSSITETAIRPRYYSAIERQSSSSKKYLTAWLIISVVGGVAVCLVFAYFHQYVSFLLLGQAFRESSHLTPWIAAGYGLLTLTHITTRICYAYDATRSVLMSEAAGALLAVVIGFPLIYTFGLEGAAMAVPLYFGIQLLLSAYLARQSIRNSYK